MLARPLPTSPAQTARAMWLGTIAGSVCAALLLIEVARPLHAIDSKVYVALITSPVWMPLGWMIIRYFYHRKPSTLPVGIMFAVLAMILVVTLAFLANWALDFSAGSERALTITDRWDRTYRNGKSYYLTVETGQLPLPLASKHYLDVLVAKTVYEQAIPGETQITIEVHPGALGIPWYR